jgi:hypothetical protein
MISFEGDGDRTPSWVSKSTETKTIHCSKTTLSVIFVILLCRGFLMGFALGNFHDYPSNEQLAWPCSYSSIFSMHVILATIKFKP